MDSGNSGSFQSSSGEDEFDSQTDGISALLNNNQAADHVVAHSNHHHHHQQPPLPPPPETPSSSYMYHNPLSNYFDLVSPPLPPQQPLQNHHPNNTLLISSDVDWLKTLRSQTTDQITTFQSLLGIQNPVDENTTTDAGILVSPPPPPPPTTANINAGKNPRKRSRASRRAPTTVLTTDTSNFRAMVQEFTGIPAAPPFTFTSASSSAPFTRNRFDLFGGRASHSHLISRPFPQKVQLGSSSSSIIDHAIIASSNSNNNNNTTFGFGININANNPNYNYFNVPNPIVSSFLEPNYTSGFPPISSTKSHQESLDISLNDSHMKMGGGLDEYSCRVNTNTHSGVPNLIYSEDQTTIRIGNNNQDGVSWQNIGVNSSQDDDQSNFNFSS